MITQSGNIIVCDIVGFSKKLQDSQLACARHLFDAVEKTSYYKALNDDQRCITCTGDGFILITNDTDPRGPLTFCFELLEVIDRFNSSKRERLKFCKEVSVSAEDFNDAKYKVRLGIHIGNFFFRETIFGRENAIGTGINISARVASVGDPGHIIISEEISRNLKQYVQINNSQCSINGWRVKISDPIIVYVKHLVKLEVKAVSATKKKGGKSVTVGEDFMPKKAALQKYFVEEAEADLIYLNGKLELWLKRFDSNLKSISEYKPRIAILTPIRELDESYLWVSDLRYDPCSSAGNAPSKTKFCIDRGEGLPSMAYNDKLGKPKFCYKLPDYNKNPELYLEMITKECNVCADNVKGWNRKAQAYISIPINAPIISDKVILSIDFANSLDLLTTAQINEMIADIRKFACPPISKSLQLHLASCK